MDYKASRKSEESKLILLCETSWHEKLYLHLYSILEKAVTTINEEKQVFPGIKGFQAEKKLNRSQGFLVHQINFAWDYIYKYMFLYIYHNP